VRTWAFFVLLVSGDVSTFSRDDLASLDFR
jgi:hypothetical protein